MRWRSPPYAELVAPGTAQHLPFLEVAPSPFRWRLGLRPLDLADWLVVGPAHDAELAAKAVVMADHPDTAFAVLDGLEDVGREVADEIVAHMARDHHRDVVPDAQLHPLDAAARVVAEDLVVMVERDGRLVCGGGSVCFPNRWDLRSKLGRSMFDVHAPVARLNHSLADPVDRFLGRLSPARSYWRRGWGVLETDDLYLPLDGTATARVEPATFADWVVRVERETLRRLPRTRAVLFTIGTRITPLRDLDDPSTLRHLADSIDAMPGDVAEYKQLAHVRGELGRWLRQRATTSERPLRSTTAARRSVEP